MEKELNSFRQDKAAGKNEKEFKGVIADEAMNLGKKEKKETRNTYFARLENGTTLWAKNEKELREKIRLHREGGL